MSGVEEGFAIEITLYRLMNNRSRIRDNAVIEGQPGTPDTDNIKSNPEEGEVLTVAGEDQLHQMSLTNSIIDRLDCVKRRQGSPICPALVNHYCVKDARVPGDEDVEPVQCGSSVL